MQITRKTEYKDGGCAVKYGSYYNGTSHTIIVKPNMEIIVAALIKLGIQVQPLQS